MSDAVLLRRATVVDAAKLAQFAERCFCETFGPDNRAEDMERYVAATFGTEHQRAVISDPAAVVFIAELNATVVGYAHLRRGAAPDGIATLSPIELKRFYITGALHGQGLAQRLMRCALDYAIECGADVIWLAVWEHNPRARSFYRKSGFVESGTQSFLLGDDDQTDIVMFRAVGD